MLLESKVKENRTNQESVSRLLKDELSCAGVNIIHDAHIGRSVLKQGKRYWDIHTRQKQLPGGVL